MSLGIVLYTFEPEYEGELFVTENQLITILETHDDGWSTVKYHSSASEDMGSGLVPTSYLKMVKAEERRLPPRPPRKNDSRRFSKGFDQRSSAEYLSSAPLLDKAQVKSLEAMMQSFARHQKWRDQWAHNAELKRRRTRISLVKELLSTEETYVSNLKLAKRLFGSIKGSDALFTGIDSIIDVNSHFLDRLREELNNFPVTWVGRVFKEYASKMIVYTDFVNNYDKAFELYQEWMTTNKKPFVSQLNKVYKKHQDELRGNLLESYLILPIQRIPRYKLLLESILKNTGQDHIERQDIEDALEDVTILAKYIDNQKKINEHSVVKGSLTEIINEYSPYKGIAHNHRGLIRDGILNVTCKERKVSPNTKFRCYLMNDLLVMTDALDGVPQSKKKNHRVEFIFMYVSTLEEGDEAFTLSTFHRKEVISLQFTADIPSEAKMWCKDIKSAISTCNALYSRYELSDDMMKLASDRCLLQEASKQSMSQYTAMNMEVTKQKAANASLQKEIRTFQEQMRKLQQMLEEKQQKLEEGKVRYNTVSDKLEYYKDRVEQCIEGVKERDRIFASLLRNEPDAFRVIFADSPSNNSFDSTSVVSSKKKKKSKRNGLDAPNSSRKKSSKGKLRRPSVLLNNSRRQAPTR